MSFADGELGFAFSRDGNKLAWRLLEEERIRQSKIIRREISVLRLKRERRGGFLLNIKIAIAEFRADIFSTVSIGRLAPP